MLLFPIRFEEFVVIRRFLLDAFLRGGLSVHAFRRSHRGAAGGRLVRPQDLVVGGRA